MEWNAIDKEEFANCIIYIILHLHIEYWVRSITCQLVFPLASVAWALEVEEAGICATCLSKVEVEPCGWL